MAATLFAFGFLAVYLLTAAAVERVVPDRVIDRILRRLGME